MHTGSHAKRQLPLPPSRGAQPPHLQKGSIFCFTNSSAYFVSKHDFLQKRSLNTSSSCQPTLMDSVMGALYLSIGSFIIRLCLILSSLMSSMELYSVAFLA